MGSMRMAVSTLVFTPSASRAELSASELITVAHMPIWSPLTRSAAQSAEDVAAADDDAYLHTHLVYLLDLAGIVTQSLRVDTIILIAHQALARELEEDSLKSCHSLICIFR